MKTRGILREVRLGNFSSEDGERIQYIRVTCRERVQALRVVVTEPNEGDPFHQVALSSVCLYQMKPYH